MSEKKKSKDPWHQENIDDTIDKRGNDQRNLLNVIQAMDSQLQHEVTQILKKHTKTGLPDWSLIDEQSKNYNKAVADEIRVRIDKVYSLDSKLHPLADIIKKADLESNYFNNKMVNGLYFKHIDKLKRTIGSKNYMGIMKKIHDENLETVTGNLEEHLLSDLDSEKHGDHIVDYMKDKYKFDGGKVNVDLMKRNAEQLMASHLRGQLSKDLIHRQYKASKPKEKK